MTWLCPQYKNIQINLYEKGSLQVLRAIVEWFILFMTY